MTVRAHRFGGGLPARQAPPQRRQQRVTGFAGIDELVETHVLGRPVRRLQLGFAQLGGEVLAGVRRRLNAAALMAPIVAPG